MIDRYIAYIFLGFVAIGPLPTIGLWLIDADFIHITKVFYYQAIVVMLYGAIKNRYLYNNIFVYYLLSFSLVVILSGLARNPLSKETFAHVEYLFLPIIGVSFGCYLSKQNSVFFRVMEENIHAVGLMSVALIYVYYFLYSSGSIPYFGVSTLIVLPLLYAVIQKKYYLLSVYVSGVALTGKRVTIVALVIVLVVKLLKDGKYNPVYSMLVFVLAGVGVWFLSENINEFDVLKRFEVLDYRKSDYDLNIALSGRVDDAYGALDRLNENLFNWVIGLGAGATFQFGYKFVHYSHFTPLSYLFLGGLALAIPVYVFLLKGLSYSAKNTASVFSLLYIYYFFAGFSGAIYLTDPFVWMVVGIVMCEKRTNASLIVRQKI